MTELELKLALDPRDVAALRKAAPLAGLRPTRRKLTSIYYDTPEGELAKAGVALRLRRSAGRWTQTLKGEAAQPGGWQERPEWEQPRPDATLDLSAAPGGASDAAAPFRKMEGRLSPAFTVEVQRETWELHPAPGTRLEVALDRGRTLAAGHSDPLCEVEIEVLEGPREAAFELARALLEAAPMRPSSLSKAERGYRLVRGTGLAPVKSRPAVLVDGMDPPAALKAIAGAALLQLQANEEGVIGTGDPEFVHQARVGLRRLRSALGQFRGSPDAEAAAGLRSELGDVARALGGARDWDVFATETLPPLLLAYGNAELSRALSRKVAARRRREREKARSVLRSPQYARLVLELTRWIGAEPPPFSQGPRERLVDFASRLVRRRHKRLVADSTDLANRSPEERHRLRIDAKRLRYGVEGFASLFKAARVGGYVRILSAIQDTLGRANDAQTATALLAGLVPAGEFAGFARGWLAARTAVDLDRLALDVARLARTRRFWRRKAPQASPGGA